MTEEKNLDVIVKNVKVDWFTNTFKTLMEQDYHQGGVQVTKSRFPVDLIYKGLLTIINSQEIIENLPKFFSQYQEAKAASEKIESKYKSDFLLYKSYENAKKNAADRSLDSKKRKEAQEKVESARKKLEETCGATTKEAFDKWFKPKADEIKAASDVYKELESKVGGAFALGETPKTRIAAEQGLIDWQKGQIELYVHFNINVAIEKIKAGVGKKNLLKQLPAKPNEVYDFRNLSGEGPGHYRLVLHPAEGSTRRLQFLNCRSKPFDNQAPLKEEKNLVYKMTQQLEASKVLIKK